MMASSLPSSEPYTLQPDPSWSAPNPLEAQLSTLALRHYLFAISQYCRSVWDVSNDAVLAATPFHSYEEPAICLSDYIVNIGRRLRVRRFTVLLAAVYVGRIAKRTNRPPSIMSIHRLYASSLLYACKVLDDHPPTEAVFAHAAGFPVCEVSEQQKILHSILGPDASDYNDDVEEALHHLEVASQLTLRSDITAAVAKAFRVAPPQLQKEDAWFEPCSTPVSIITLERIPSHLAFGSSMHSSSGSGSSTDSQYVAFGSGASAVRGLRSNRSLSSSLLTPHDEKPMLSFAMPTFGLPSFTARFPSSLHSHSDTAVTPSAPSLKIASTTAHSPTDDSHVKNMLPPSRFP